jgi:hypothetical protein
MVIKDHFTQSVSSSGEYYTMDEKSDVVIQVKKIKKYNK